VLLSHDISPENVKTDWRRRNFPRGEDENPQWVSNTRNELLGGRQTRGSRSQLARHVRSDKDPTRVVGTISRAMIGLECMEFKRLK